MQANGTYQFKDLRSHANLQQQQMNIIQRKCSECEKETAQRKENKTGLPDNLKSGIENLSGIGMDDVRVHYNSSKPAQLNALAYAQGSDIHVASGQEKHLPHEAWHVVQQKQGRVKPTIQMKTGTPVNDDQGLEKEADTMGARALRSTAATAQRRVSPSFQPVVQRYTWDRHWKVSESTAYKVNTQNPVFLYVLDGAAGPEPADKFKTSGRTGNYTRYKFDAVFENDCLNFAEYLSRGSYKKESAFHGKYDQGKKRGRLFGESDKQNVGIAQDPSFSKGKDADPGIGEAFTTIRHKQEAQKCPYHVAMVVALDGVDRVTCEGDAGAELDGPVFDMYAVGGSKKKKSKLSVPSEEPKSFHETYEESYSVGKKIKTPPTTGVLVPRI